MRRRVLAAIGCGLLGLALTGCGASQTAKTAQDRPSVPGINVTEAGIAVRNAVVAYDPAGYQAGAAAPVELALYNGNEQPVRLVRATSPAGQEVTVTSAATIVDPGTTEGQPEPEPAQPEPGGAAELALAPGQFLTATLAVSGLAEDLNSASLLPVELVFDNGAEFSLTVPVAPPLEPAPRGERLEGVGHH